MKKWNLIIDVAKCENCNNCVLAAKDEHIGNEFPGYSAPAAKEGAELITISRNHRGQAPVVDTSYLIRMCNHCDNAPCMKHAGDAIHKRQDGIVIIDPEKAKGRKDIVKSCPYGAIVWNEEQQVPQTWIFDAHLLDQGWTQPRCAQSCPTGVFESIKATDTEMQDICDKNNLEVLHPQFNAKPRVYYRNLHRFTHCFIGGTVICDINNVEDCIQGATVKLLKNNQVLAKTTTDAFGEFKIDKLEANSGSYDIIIEHQDFQECRTSCNLAKSIYLGEIRLKTGEPASSDNVEEIIASEP